MFFLVGIVYTMPGTIAIKGGKRRVGRRRRTRYKTKKEQKAHDEMLKTAKAVVSRAVSKAVETNYHDRTLINVSVDYAGTSFYAAAATSQGNTDIARTGDKLSPTGWHINGEVIVGDTTNMVRVLAVQYMLDPNNEAASLAKLLSSTYSATVGYPLAPYNHDNKEVAFRVLRDKVFALSNTGSNGIQIFGWKIEKSELRTVRYSAGGATPISGALYIVAVSDSSAAAHPTLVATSRLFYKP